MGSLLSVSPQQAIAIIDDFAFPTLRLFFRSSPKAAIIIGEELPVQLTEAASAPYHSTSADAFCARLISLRKPIKSEERQEVRVQIWEALLWSQQGISKMPVLNPCNVIGIKIEEGTTFVADKQRGPAFVSLIMGKADGRGLGTKKCIVFNGTAKLVKSWREELKKWKVDVQVEEDDRVQLDFDFCVPKAPKAWSTAQFSFTHDDILRRFDAGKAHDHSSKANRLLIGAKACVRE